MGTLKSKLEEIFEKYDERIDESRRKIVEYRELSETSEPVDNQYQYKYLEEVTKNSDYLQFKIDLLDILKHLENIVNSRHLPPKYYRGKELMETLTSKILYELGSNIMPWFEQYYPNGIADDKFRDLEWLYKLEGDGKFSIDTTVWLITNYKPAQTPEMIKYFQSLSPKPMQIFELMNNCEYAQTPGMLEFYIMKGANGLDVARIIVNFEFAQTPEMLERFKSLNPCADDVAFMIRECEYAQTPEMMEYYLSLNPSERSYNWLAHDCDFAYQYLEERKKWKN